MSETILRRVWQAIKRWRWQALALAVAMLLAIAVFGWFGVTTPDRTAEQSFMSRAEARHQGAVTVRAAVLTDDESQRYFGASLADHGIQAIWLGVDNADSPQDLGGHGRRQPEPDQDLREPAPAQQSSSDRPGALAGSGSPSSGFIWAPCGSEARKCLRGRCGRSRRRKKA